MVFDRAVEQLNSLDDVIGAWTKESVNVVSREVDSDVVEGWMRYGPPQPGEVGHEFVVRFDEPVDPTWALVLGEVIHGFRTSLDHLAFTLAERYTGPLPDDVAEQSEFPIFWRPPKGNALAKKIRGVDPNAQALIESLQPYRDPDYRENPLWVLHELDRKRKHRTLPVVAAAANTSAFVNPFGLTAMMVSAGRVEDGTVIAHAAALPSPGGEVDMDFEWGVVVVIDGGPALGTASETLWTIREWIEARVFPPLEPFL